MSDQPNDSAVTTDLTLISDDEIDPCDRNLNKGESKLPGGVARAIIPDLLGSDLNPPSTIDMNPYTAMLDDGPNMEVDEDNADQSSDALEQRQAPSDDTTLSDDEEDFIEWMEYVPVHMILGTPNYRHLSPIKRKFLSGGWDLLSMSNKRDSGGIAVFVGMEPESLQKLPLGWRQSIKFSVSAVSKDGDFKLLWSESQVMSVGSVTDRMDLGKWDMIPPSLYSNQDSNTIASPDTMPFLYKGNNGEIFIRLKVRLDAFFMPARVSHGYNSHASTNMVGIYNLGATCYLNALLQMLFHVNKFRRAVYSLPHAEEVFGESTTLSLQHLFKDLQCSQQPVSTRDLTKSFGWTAQDSFLQQDVQEMMRVLLDKLEDKMKGTVVDGVIKSLFSGTIRSFIKCVNVDYESKREEEFYDIQLVVKDCRSIYDSFEKYTAKETLDGENQYDAESFGKQDANKGIVFTKLPPVLTIHLKRFDFDLQKMGYTKIHDYFEFPVRLELDRFLAEDSPEESRATPNVYLLHSVLVHAGDVGGGHYYAYIRPSTGYKYGQESQEAATANTTTTAAAAASAASTDDVDGELPSRHEGEVGSDENTDPLASNDPKNLKSSNQKSRGRWYKFDDETVLRVKAKEAIDNCFGRRTEPSPFMNGMSSAYMLVYIREAEAMDIMSNMTECDIPQDLMQRLEAEVERKRKEQKQRERESLYELTNYHLEQDIASRHVYSYRSLDFFLENPRSLKVLKGSTLLHYLIRFSDVLGVPPNHLLLFNTTYKEMNDGSRFKVRRVGQCFKNLKVTRNKAVKHLDAYDMDDDIYVHIQSSLDDNVNLAQLENDQPLFLSKYHDIRTRESEWIGKVRVALQEMNVVVEDDYDPVECLGIGSSLKILELNLSSDVFESLKQELISLNDEMLNLLESVMYCGFEGNAAIQFIKLFDPRHNFEPQIWKPFHDYPLLVEEEMDVSSPDNVQDYANFDRYFNPCPLKYLGSYVATQSSLLGQLHYKYLDFIDRSLSKQGREVPKEFMQQLVYTQIYDPQRLIRLENDIHPETAAENISLFSIRALKKVNPSAFIKLEIIIIEPAIDETRDLFPPFKIFDAKEFIFRLRWIRCFTLSPFSDVDGEIVKSAIEWESQMQDQLASSQSTASHASGLGEGNDFGVESGTKRKFPAQGPPPPDGQVLAHKMATENSDAASIAKLAPSSASNTQPAGDDSDREKSVADNTTFQVDLSLDMVDSSVVEILSKYLRIKPEYILIYFSAKNSVKSPANLSRALRACGFQKRDASRSLENIVAKELKFDSKFFYPPQGLLYRICPYPTLIPTTENDIVPSMKFFCFFEVVIVDERIKKMRRAFLHDKRQFVDGGEDVLYISNPALTAGNDQLQQQLAATATNKRARLGDSDGSGDVGGKSEYIWQDDYQLSQRVKQIPTHFLCDNKVYLDLKFVGDDGRARIVQTIMPSLRAYVGIALNVPQPDVSEDERIQFLTHCFMHRHDNMEEGKEDKEDDDDDDDDGDLQAIDQVTTRNRNERLKEKFLTFCDEVLCDGPLKNPQLVQESNSFPLVMYITAADAIEEFICKFIDNSMEIRDAYISWMGSVATYRYLNRHRLYMQHVTIEDLIYMSGCGPVKSTLVCVINFTLLGNIIKSCDSNSFFPPCLCYVREDDDLETFAQRLSLIVGDDDYSKCRFAVVSAENRAPKFIPRSNNASASASAFPSNGGGAGNEQNASTTTAAAANPSSSFFAELDSDREKQAAAAADEGIRGKRASPAPPPVSMWDLLKEAYPYHVKNTDVPLSQNKKTIELSGMKEQLPIIGIQRSASSVAPTRTNYLSSITIK